jgi:hypothetical protein
MAKRGKSRAEMAKELYDKRMKEKEEFDNRDNSDSNYIKVDWLPSGKNWKDKEKRTLRILPARDVLQFYLDNADDDEAEYENESIPMQELRTHFNVGSQNGICSCLSYWNNEPCPVCEEIEELKSTGEEDDKKEADSMWPKRRFARFVLWREHSEPNKVWLWECNWSTDTDIVALYNNTKVPDPDLIFDGTDIEVTREGAAGNSKTTYRVEDVREESMMVVDEDGEFDWEAAEEILANLPDIFEHGKPFLDYEETKMVVEGYSVKDVVAMRYEEGEDSGESDVEPPFDTEDEEPEDKPTRGKRGSKGKTGRPTRGKRGSK